MSAGHGNEHTVFSVFTVYPTSSVKKKKRKKKKDKLRTRVIILLELVKKLDHAEVR